MTRGSASVEIDRNNKLVYSAIADVTRVVTESYGYTAARGSSCYEMLRRPAALVRAMQRTIERIKPSVESQERRTGWDVDRVPRRVTRVARPVLAKPGREGGRMDIRRLG